MGKSGWMLLLGLWSAAGWAASLDVQLLDNKGKALGEAVLWIEPGPAPGPDTPALMDQKRRQFTPYILPVQVGTTVSFPNSDPINHHVYSFSPAKRFELRMHQHKAAPQEVLFEQPGLVTLGCNIHDWMLGFILVLDSPWFTQTDKDGRARLDFSPAAGQRLHVWHPRINETSETTQRPLGGETSLTWQLSSPLKRDPRPKTPKMRPQGKGGYVP